MSFRYKLAATIFALQALLMVAVAWQSGDVLNSVLDEHKSSEHREILDLLSSYGRSALTDGNFDVVQASLVLFAHDERVERALLANADGIILAGSPDSMVGQAAPATVDSDSSTWTSLRIDVDDDTSGRLIIEFSRAHIVELRSQVRRRIILTSLVGLILISAISYALSSLLTRNLEYLAETAARISKGSWQERANVSGGGEVAAVAQAVNELAENADNQMAALMESRARYRALVDLTPNAIFVQDKGKIEFANKSAITMFGATHEEDLLGLDINDLVHEEDRSFAQQAMRDIANNKPMDYIEIRWTGLDGREIRSESTGTMYDYRDEHRVFVIIRDITERRRAEDMQRQSQRLEAIGQLTGGVAHDFNNLLAVIIWNLEVLREEVEGDEYQTETLERASRAAERGSELVKQLLAFSRRQSLRTIPLNLNRSIANTVDMVSRTLGEAIKIETITADDLWSTAVDPVQIENTILNLAINSRDAMPDGGELVLETTNIHLEQAEVIDGTMIEAGDYVTVSITDDGAGMEPEVAEHAFEPFYTTKHVGQGTGLGLSTVYGFVKQSKGYVTLASTLGEGTCVRLYLPKLKESGVVQIEGFKDEQAPSGAGEEILVVEDNQEVLASVEKLIRDFGYNVQTASNGQEALDIIDGAGPQDFDMMLTDIGLEGGMDGWELSMKAREKLPNLKVLYMSGYADNVLADVGLKGAERKLLRKPFRRAELGQRLREVLDGDIV